VGKKAGDVTLKGRALLYLRMANRVVRKTWPLTHWDSLSGGKERMKKRIPGKERERTFALPTNPAQRPTTEKGHISTKEITRTLPTSKEEDLE